MSEFITIQVGQCGNQIGQSFWSGVLEEYGILNGDTSNQLQTSLNSFFAIDEHSQHSPPFYNINELVQNNVKARAVLIDMENSVISRCLNSSLGSIYDNKCIVRNYTGSGNNWAQAFCNFGPNYKNQILKSIRHAVEKCDSLQGFLFMFSVGGGTGSGLGTFILKLLEDSYPHVERLVSCVYPTGTEDVITCPYNIALATKQLKEHASCVIPIENRALDNILKRRLLYDTERNLNETSFSQINNIIVKMLLHLTSGSRFNGNMNVDINEISTNMSYLQMPYENHPTHCYVFLQVLFTFKTACFSRVEKDELYNNTCNKDNQFVKLDPFGCTILASSLIARGSYTLSDMRNYVERLQRKNCYTNWSRKAIKIGLCNTPSIGEDISLLSLFNTTSMSSLFTYILKTFKKVYKKKAHLHHYLNVDGFSDDYFTECTESLLESIDSYKIYN